jgi:hypothetical protein
MFMFRKKVTQVSTSANLQKEAKKFQAAITDINANFRPAQIDISVVEGAAKKFETDVALIADAYAVYLRTNAIEGIKKIKATEDYTVLQLERVAQSFGFELDDLGVSYFSEE